MSHTKHTKKKESPLKGTSVPLFEWFVTVVGYDSSYTPSHEIVSTTILLRDGQTPIDWFKSKPRVYARYARFSFTPYALVNWHSMEKDVKR